VAELKRIAAKIAAENELADQLYEALAAGQLSNCTMAAMKQQAGGDRDENNEGTDEQDALEQLQADAIETSRVELALRNLEDRATELSNQSSAARAVVAMSSGGGGGGGGDRSSVDGGGALDLTRILQPKNGMLLRVARFTVRLRKAVKAALLITDTTQSDAFER
jgi:hypothetical protein